MYTGSSNRGRGKGYSNHSNYGFCVIGPAAIDMIWSLLAPDQRTPQLTPAPPIRGKGVSGSPLGVAHVLWCFSAEWAKKSYSLVINMRRKLRRKSSKPIKIQRGAIVGVNNSVWLVRQAGKASTTHMSHETLGQGAWMGQGNSGCRTSSLWYKLCPICTTYGLVCDHKELEKCTCVGKGCKSRLTDMGLQGLKVGCGCCSCGNGYDGIQQSASCATMGQGQEGT